MNGTIRKVENYLRRHGIKWYLLTFSLLSILFLITVIITTWNVHVQYYTSCSFKVKSYNINDLPKIAKPQEYNISINPSISSNLFYGFVSLKFQVLKSTACIVLHSNNLTVTKVKMDKNIDVKFSYFNNSITVVYFTGILFSLENHSLEINYTGNIENSFYIDKNNDLLMTRNDPLSASKWFPCFDQVEWRSNFILQMNVTNIQDKKVISSMPVDKLENGTLYFQKSPLITTSQIGFIIGNFYIKESKDNFTVYTLNPNDNVLMLDIVLNCTQFFENFFDYPLDYPKLDVLHYDDYLIEKYGILVTRKNKICELISRRWNGGLFSPSIGNYWLSLGLGKFLSYYSANKINIFENSWEMYFQDVLAPYLNMDSYPFSVPLISKEKKLEDFETRKGSLLFYNLLTYLKEDGLKNLLRKFVQQYKFQMVTTENFISVFNSIYPDVKDIMKSWLELPGYPLIQVNNYNNSYQFIQKRFFGVPFDNPNTIWWIPIKYKNIIGEEKVILLDQITINTTFEYHLFDILPGSYRVNYSESMWESLINNCWSLDKSEKYFLIENSFELALTNNLDFKVPLNIIKNLKNERSIFVLETIYQKMDYLYNILSNFPSLEYFTLNKFVRDFSNYNSTIFLKFKILSEEETTITDLRTKFITSNFTIDERLYVYMNLVRSGSYLDYLKIYEIYLNSTDENEKRECLYALTQSKEKSTYLNSIQLAIDIQQIEILFNLAKNFYALDDLWNYIRVNHNLLKSKFQSYNNLILEVTNRFVIRMRFIVSFSI